MKIKTKIHPSFQELELHICNCEMNQQVLELQQDLKRMYGKQIAGLDQNGNQYMLAQTEISRFFAQKQKVFAEKTDGQYVVSKKLYELEEELDKDLFIRISKSEIINMRKIKMVNMDQIGTIKIIMSDGTETYVSRRNVTSLKKALQRTMKGKVCE